MRKKSIFLLSAFSLILGATSCQKKYCFECTTTRYFIENNDTATTQVEKKAQCDITKKEAMKIEDNGTSTVNYFNNGAPVVETQRTKCDYR